MLRSYSLQLLVKDFLHHHHHYHHHHHHPQEIVLYAYYKKLDYFSTECVYAPFAARGQAREFIKDLEVRGSGSCVGWFVGCVAVVTLHQVQLCISQAECLTQPALHACT